MEMTEKEKPTATNSKPILNKTGVKKMKVIAGYHEQESSAPEIIQTEIIQGLQAQFKNIHETLCLIRNLVSLTGDDKADALVNEMSIAAIGPMHRIRTELDIPY